MQNLLSFNRAECARHTCSLDGMTERICLRYQLYNLTIALRFWSETLPYRHLGHMTITTASIATRRATGAGVFNGRISTIALKSSESHVRDPYTCQPTYTLPDVDMFFLGLGMC